jgi:hypothetical protein
MEALPGHSLLVGLTYVGTDLAVLNRRQFLGEVVAPAEGAAPGLYVRSPGGELVSLPPDTAAVLPAPRGQYRCLVSGETLSDPDLLTSWRITVDNGAARWEANYAPHVRSIVPDEWEFTYRHDAAHLRRFLDKHAKDYLGKRVRVALQLYMEDEDGAASRFLGEEERAGRIARASYGEGVIVALDSGKEFRLPPDLSLLQPASPGENSPAAQPGFDLITRWTVLRSPEDDEA